MVDELDEEERQAIAQCEKAGLPVIKAKIESGRLGGTKKHQNAIIRWVAEKEKEIKREEDEKRQAEREEDARRRSEEIERLEKIERKKIRLTWVWIGVSLTAVLISFLSWLFPRTDTELEERIRRLEEKVAVSPSDAP